MERDFIKQRLLHAVNHALPLDFDIVLVKMAAIEGFDVRVGKRQNRFDSVFSGPDEMLGFFTADGNVIAIQITTVMKIKSETMIGFKRHCAVRLAEKEQIVIFNDHRVSDAA